MAKVKENLKLYHRFVKDKALELRKEGFRVRANIRGFLKPGKVGPYKFIPDIVAVRNNLIRVYEVTNSYTMRECNSQVFFRRLKTITHHFKAKRGRFTHYMLPLIPDDMKGHIVGAEKSYLSRTK